MADNTPAPHDSGVPAAARKRPAALGRGLGALLGESRPAALSGGGASGADDTLDRGDSVRMLAIASITPLPGQPRRHFDETALAELSQSIRERGVIQPIIVRVHPSRTGYQLVAGERRWRAAQAAGLHEIPALVRGFDDAATFEIALIENIQRQDLNAIDEAQAYARLMADFSHSAEALGRIVGKSRSHVANLLRLLELPAPVQSMVVDGQLSMGHARALVGVPDAQALADRIVAQGLSVRDVERLSRSAKGGKTRSGTKSGARDADIVAVEQHLADLLGLNVGIAYDGAGHGAVTLKFRTLDQLDMLCQRLSGETF